MANEEQLVILRQGVQVWNEWRRGNSGIKIDLVKSNLRAADLARANFSGVDLSDAALRGADLRKADLFGANLSRANLFNVKLNGADLRSADLSEADLRQANLTGALLNETNLRLANLRQANLRAAQLINSNLSGVSLVGAKFGSSLIEDFQTYDADDDDLWVYSITLADLSGAKLNEADLRQADFSLVSLQGTNFSEATIGMTVFAQSDLSEVVGLEEIYHSSPSDISMDTLARSRGKLPEVFLRGCGLSDWEVEVARLSNPDLSNEEINNIQYKMYDLRATRALQISPLFISYSHRDGDFVDKIDKYLTKKGIRFWRDIHDMKAGRMERQIDRAIRQNPTVLLVLSEHSLASDWMEHEVRIARGTEKDLGRDTLCPVALDDSWKDSRWEKHLMEQVMKYNILDFSEWEDDVKFEGMFRKLIDGLELFYKG